ncbi:MAG TPA: UbiA family prenyltransferase [Gemmatimonadaceae bacterium]|nr:UbiA family prenyltransferase [Gemmatimonadaceae bacterium]
MSASSRSSQAVAFARLGRWPNALIAGAGVIVGAWWAGEGIIEWSGVTLAALGAFSLAFAAYAWNDAADVDIDRVAHPKRPIPQGLITVQSAGRFAAVASVVGVVLSMLARLELGALALVAAAAMRIYSPSLKRRGLPGNVAVAFLASLPFLWGAWAVDAPQTGLLLVLIAAPLHFAREIAKDLDDAAADAGWRRTLPLSAGYTAARATMLLALLTFVGMLVPLASTTPLFAVAAVPAILLAAFAAVRSWRGSRGGPLLFKAAMLSAMAALLVSRA